MGMCNLRCSHSPGDSTAGACGSCVTPATLCLPLASGPACSSRHALKQGLTCSYAHQEIQCCRSTSSALVRLTFWDLQCELVRSIAVLFQRGDVRKCWRCCCCTQTQQRDGSGREQCAPPAQQSLALCLIMLLLRSAYCGAVLRTSTARLAPLPQHMCFAWCTCADDHLTDWDATLVC